MNCGGCLRFKSFHAENAWLGYCGIRGNVSMMDLACSQYIVEKHLEVFELLFVNRVDTYAVQKEDAKYRRISEPLTRDVLKSHLRGKITVGSYQLDQESNVKDLIFDIDEKLKDPDETTKRILQEYINIPTPEKPRFYPKSVLLEASRYPDLSFHIRVMFALKTPARVARWFGVKILEHANISPKLVEVFPKQAKLEKDRQFGNFVKLPLGKHQVAQKWSRFLDLESFEPLSNDCLFDVEGASFLDRDIKRILSFGAKKHVQLGLQLPKSHNSLNDIEEREIATLLGRYWRPGYRNRLEMAFLGWCLKKGVSFESAHRVVNAVTTNTRDEEKRARLNLVKYHYETRREMTQEMKGSTGIREVIREVIRR